MKTAIAILAGLAAYALDWPVTILSEPVRVSFIFGTLLPLLVAMSWGGRYGVVAATIGLGVQSCWRNWPENGYANIFTAAIYTAWLGWHGWAARRRAAGCGGGWTGPYAVQALWSIALLAGMVTIYRWSFWMNPAPWAPRSAADMPMGVISLITIKAVINAFLLVLIADLVLHIGGFRRMVGLLPRPGGRYDSRMVAGCVIVASSCWTLDATVTWLLAAEPAPTWWREFAAPTPERMTSRLLIVTICLACGIVVAGMLRRQVRNSEDLRASEEHLRITLDSIGEAVIVTDGSGRIVRMNDVAVRLCGWTAAEAIGRPLSAICPAIVPQAGGTAPDLVARVLGTGSAAPTVQSVLRIRDGSERLVASSAAPIRAGSGGMLGVVVIVRDITDEQRLQEQLTQARKLESLGQLAGGVAHDFNNMLTGILGAADLLREFEADPQRRQLLDMVHTSGRRAAGLTRSLLAFARKGTGLQAPVPVHAALGEAVAMLEHTIDRRIRIESSLAAERDVVLGDLAELQAAFLNLGVNAAHAMPRGGRLSFASRVGDPPADLVDGFGLAGGRYIEIQVSDTGTGIPADVLPRIFDPFFTTKAPGKGTGLGLTAAYGTIRHHRGAIAVASTPGAGTRFTIYLPLADGTPAPRNADPPPPPRLQGQGRVLVVDDEQAVRDTLVLMLSGMGYSAETACDGAAAVAACTPGRFDLVILDIMMPAMDGLGACRAIRDRDPHQRIIICSGYADDSVSAAVADLRIRHVLPKPFTQADLAAVIGRAMAT